MSATSTTTGRVRGAHALPRTREERMRLLRSLYAGHTLESALPARRRRPPARRFEASVLAGIAAAAALEAEDRLFVPHHLLTARLGHGADIDAAIIARTAASGAAAMPQTAVALAAGAAWAMRNTDAAAIAAAIVEVGWLDDPTSAAAITFADEHALPLVAVGIGPPELDEETDINSNGSDLEAIRQITASAVTETREEPTPAIVRVPAPAPSGAGAGTGGRDGHPREDILARYEAFLRRQGFARTELDEIRRSATAEVSDALADHRQQRRSVA